MTHLAFSPEHPFLIGNLLIWASFTIWMGWEFLQSSNSGSFLFNSPSLYFILLNILLYVARRNEAMLSTRAWKSSQLNIQVHCLQASPPHTHFYCRTQFSSVFCHYVAGSPFPAVSNNIFLLSFWALGSSDSNIDITIKSPKVSIIRQYVFSTILLTSFWVFASRPINTRISINSLSKAI